MAVRKNKSPRNVKPARKPAASDHRSQKQGEGKKRGTRSSGGRGGLDISASNAERICGFHAIESTLERRSEDFIGIWFDQSRSDQRSQTLLTQAQDKQIAIHGAVRESMNEVAGEVRHQGVIALVKLPKPRQQEELFDLLDQLEKTEKVPLLLILDRVQDPHNLGACLRSAEGAGVDAVIVPRDGSAPVTEVVRRVAAGAADRIPLFYVTNLARMIDSLKERGVWMTGTADEASNAIYQSNLSGSAAIIMGAEGKGLRRLTRERCDHLVSIPMAGSVSSLNVSVATGVILFEAVRQRLEQTAINQKDLQ